MRTLQRALCVQAERVTRWIKKHAYVALGLMLRFLGTEFDRVSDGCLEVRHLEVKMHHHLLCTVGHRPDWTNVVSSGLKDEIGDAIRWPNGSVLRRLFRDIPTQRGTSASPVRHPLTCATVEI